VFKDARIVDFGGQKMTLKSRRLANFGVNSVHYHRYAKSDGAYRRLPLPWITVVLTLGTPSRWRPTGGDWSPFPRLAIRGHGGSWTEGKDDPASGCEYLTALIEPWAFYCLAGIPARDVAGVVVDGRAVALLRDQMNVDRIQETNDPAMKLRLFAEAFCLRDTHCDSRVVRFSRLCRESGGAIRIAESLPEISLSERQLRSVFSSSIGWSPKKWIRLERFSAYLHDLHPTRPLPSVVPTQLGYFDQSHAIKDFQAFTGTTPREYARQKAAGDPRIFLLRIE
jgi:AraC-like DNA-binding protein